LANATGNVINPERNGKVYVSYYNCPNPTSTQEISYNSAGSYIDSICTTSDGDYLPVIYYYVNDQLENGSNYPLLSPYQVLSTIVNNYTCCEVISTPTPTPTPTVTTTPTHTPPSEYCIEYTVNYDVSQPSSSCGIGLYDSVDEVTVTLYDSPGGSPINATENITIQFSGTESIDCAGYPTIVYPLSVVIYAGSSSGFSTYTQSGYRICEWDSFCKAFSIDDLTISSITPSSYGICVIPTLTPTPTQTPTPTPSCLCHFMTYNDGELPGDLYVRYRSCNGSLVTELISGLYTDDNGDGTYTAHICVSVTGSYNNPVCVQNDNEVVCPNSLSWTSTLQTCNSASGCSGSQN